MNIRPFTGSFENSLNVIGGLIVPATDSATEDFLAILVTLYIKKGYITNVYNLVDPRSPINM
jgi:hypothetical protein